MTRSSRSGTAPIVAFWLATRLVILAVAYGAMRTKQTTFTEVVSRWDVLHYLAISQLGYIDPQEWAFFPGLPLLMHALDQLGLPPVVAAVVLANVCSALAAWALYRLYGTWAACAWLCLPMTVFTAVPYTEPFFCAAAFWAWERAEAGRWHIAALLAAVACSLRISGLFLVAALGVMLLVQTNTSRRDKLNQLSWLALALVPAGIYQVYLHHLSGSWLAWYEAQGAGWQRTLSWPWEAVKATWPMTSPEYWPGRPEVPVMFRFELASALTGYLVTIGCLVKKRWAEAGWVAINVLALTCSGWIISVNRAVLLWMPLAGFIGWLADRPVSSDATRRLRLAGLVALTAASLGTTAYWSWCFFTGGWAS